MRHGLTADVNGAAHAVAPTQKLGSASSEPGAVTAEDEVRVGQA